MTKYLDKKFTVPVGTSEAYRDNWDVIFGKKGEAFWNEPGADDSEDAESCDFCGGTEHGKVSFELGRQTSEAEIIRLRDLARSLHAGREELPEWARLRVEEMLKP